MKNVDYALENIIVVAYEHRNKVRELKTPFERSVEEFSYNKKLKECIEDIRASLTLEEFDKFLPTLVLNYDFYDTI